MFKGEFFMSQKYIVTVLAVVGAFVASGSVMAGEEGHAPGPCKQIAKACMDAGFKKGDWKKGDGLWRDCVDPIMQGQTTVPGATKTLPTVDASVVSACKAKHPKFGGGKVGS
jgi:hypothetical protein